MFILNAPILFGGYSITRFGTIEQSRTLGSSPISRFAAYALVISNYSWLRATFKKGYAMTNKYLGASVSADWDFICCDIIRVCVWPT